MSKEKRRVPKLRFPGFTEDWEQRKLGEIGKWYKGIGGTKDDLNTKRSGRMFVHYADLYQTSEFLTTVVHWTTNENIGSLITPNSILFPMSDVTPYGLARTTSCKINEVRAGGDVLINTIDKSIDSNFVSIYINLFSKNIFPFVIGTTVKHINSKALSELTILIPSFEEQLKIVNVVNFYNKVITLHQRKLEHLNLKKKALLQKLFPKNGERYPELRFPGFTDAWEQRKLSDITEIVMGQSPSSKNYTDNPNDNILVQGNADLKDGKVVPRLWTKEITKTIDKDGIILTVRAPVGDVAKTDYKVVLGRGVAGIKGNDYIYQFLQKLQNNRYWVSLSSGSTFESINSNVIKDLIIDIPSIEEQTKISMLLNNVNSIITLHQRKLDHLQLQKKALLQQMFV